MQKKNLKFKSIKHARDNRNIIPSYKYYASLFIMIGIFLCPFLAHLKIFKMTSAGKSLLENVDGYGVDIFLYYKSLWVILLGVSIVILLVGERLFSSHSDKQERNFLQKKCWRKIILCVTVCLVESVISFFFSDYKWEGIWGAPFAWEGIIVIFSYAVIFIGSIIYFDNPSAFRIFKVVLTVFCCIWIILSIIEIVYRPLFEIGFFQRFLASDQYYEAMKSLENQEYRGMTALAMYNPDYYGGMCVMIFPFMVIFSMLEDKKSRYGYTFLAAGIFCCTAASNVTTSMYCIILELFILGILCRKQIRSYVEQLVRMLIVLLVFIGVLSILSKGSFLDGLKQAFTNASVLDNGDERFELKCVTLEDGLLTIEGKEDILVIQWAKRKGEQQEHLICTDVQDNDVKQQVLNEAITFQDKRFDKISIRIEEPYLMVSCGYKNPMKFYITTEGLKGVGPNGLVLETINAEERETTKVDSLFTGRGYTWERSLPLLKQCILVGKGPGTFAYYFPQFDYAGLLTTHGDTDFVITKPHNFYMQTLVAIGGIGLCALLFLCILTLKGNWKLINIDFKKENQMENQIRIAGTTVIISWLVYSMFNDSMIAVSTVFFFIFGMNLAILLKKYGEKTNEN